MDMLKQKSMVWRGRKVKDEKLLLSLFFEVPLTDGEAHFKVKFVTQWSSVTARRLLYVLWGRRWWNQIIKNPHQKKRSWRSRRTESVEIEEKESKSFTFLFFLRSTSLFMRQQHSPLLVGCASIIIIIISFFTIFVFFFFSLLLSAFSLSTIHFTSISHLKEIRGAEAKNNTTTTGEPSSEKSAQHPKASAKMDGVRRGIFSQIGPAWTVVGSGFL